MTSKYTRAARDYLNLPISLEWLANIGFKIGVFLCLKSFIAFRNLSTTLSGNIIILTEMVIAIILICGGVIAQRPNILEKPSTVFFVGLLYLLGFLVGTIVGFIQGIANWKFYEPDIVRNPLMSAASIITNFIKNGIADILFIDLDLWCFVCFLLAAVMIVYVIAITIGKNRQ